MNAVSLSKYLIVLYSPFLDGVREHAQERRPGRWMTQALWRGVTWSEAAIDHLSCRQRTSICFPAAVDMVTETERETTHGGGTPVSHEVILPSWHPSSLKDRVYIFVSMVIVCSLYWNVNATGSRTSSVIFTSVSLASTTTPRIYQDSSKPLLSKWIKQKEEWMNGLAERKTGKKTGYEEWSLKYLPTDMAQVLID